MAKNPESNRQPEALAKFGEQARNKNAETKRPGLFADGESDAIPTAPKLKQDAAEKVLREGVYHDDEGADAAIKKLPDRASRK